MLKLYNTLTKQVEELKFKDTPHPAGLKEGGLVRMYTCGPTIYNYAHIGNLRSYVMADFLHRTLKLLGFQPYWVMNLTDIDDKTIKGTLTEYGQDAGLKELFLFTEKYRKAFMEDLKKINVAVDEIEFVRVTDKMKDIQAFIVGLLEKGYAYKAEDGSVYFSIEKYQKDFGDYGSLVGEKFLEGKKIGARVAVDEYEKDNLSDFALWKKHKPETDGNIFWEHKTLGAGRPGWHIECSAINALAFGGEPTDIHTGGVDLVFPHHTNEIAQSQPFYKPFSRCWYHNEHLMVDGGRMGKRFNNFYTISDLEKKGFSGQDLRYFFLNSRFTATQNFTFEGLQAAKTAKEKLLNLPFSEKLPEGFVESLKDDLNLPGALASVWSSGFVSKEVLDFLGFFPEEAFEAPNDVLVLVSEREIAKKNKDFKKSDDLRIKIEDLGFEIMDTPEGQKLKKKVNII